MNGSFDDALEPREQSFDSQGSRSPSKQFNVVELCESCLSYPIHPRYLESITETEKSGIDTRVTCGHNSHHRDVSGHNIALPDPGYCVEHCIFILPQAIISNNTGLQFSNRI